MEIIVIKFSSIMENGPIYLYFDHNIWVQLHKNHYLEEDRKDTLLSNVEDLLWELLIKKKIRVISNFTTLRESQARKDEESRISIINFIMKYTKCFFHSPNNEFTDFERYNWICDHYQTHQLKKPMNILIGNRIDNWIGRSISKFKDPDNLKILKQLDNLRSKEFSTNLLFPHLMMKYRMILDNTDAMEIVEENQDEQNQARSIKNYNQRISKFFISYLSTFIKRINLMLQNFIKKHKKIVISAPFPDTSTFKLRLEYLKNFPSIYTNFTLSIYRNSDIKRNIKKNDAMDIWNYSVPIPYCDVVVGERSFISLAKQAKLDKIFSTQLFNTFQDLQQFLIDISV